MSEYFPKLKPSGGRVKAELVLPNYAPKPDLKNAKDVEHQTLLKRLIQQA